MSGVKGGNAKTMTSSAWEQSDRDGGITHIKTDNGSLGRFRLPLPFPAYPQPSDPLYFTAIAQWRRKQYAKP